MTAVSLDTAVFLEMQRLFLYNGEKHIPEEKPWN